MLGLAALFPWPTGGDKGPSRKRVYLAEVFIAGFQYHEGMSGRVMRSLRKGDVLALKREPDNPHDANAVAVYARSGRKPGYIPRTDNSTAALIADQTVEMGAEVVRIAPKADPWERVRIKVFQPVWPAFLMPPSGRRPRGCPCRP